MKWLYALATVLPLSAHAHHAMDSATPSSPIQGLLSGLAHPVIGLDHLLFIIAVGALSYYFARGAGTVLVFVAATLAGTAIHLAQLTLPFPEVWVALSVLALGVLVLRGARFLRTSAATAFVSVCGLIHGYAYGEAVIGAETTPLFAYLVGFTLVQLAIAAAAFRLARYTDEAKPRLAARAALGATLSTAGVVFLGLAMI